MLYICAQLSHLLAPHTLHSIVPPVLAHAGFPHDLQEFPSLGVGAAPRAALVYIIFILICRCMLTHSMAYFRAYLQSSRVC